MRSGRFLIPLLLIILSTGLFRSIPLVDAQTSDPTTTSFLTTADPLALLWQSEFSADAALASPSDVVVDSDGYSYITTQATKNIKKFDQDGKFVAQWGGFGDDEGKFNLTSGIAVDAENNVYVADFNNIRIQKFDSDGNFLLQWATEAPRGPASLGIDADGYIYVDNFFPHKHHLQKFDAAGTLVSEWGATGGEPGQFGAKGASGPEDVAIDQAGNIYVSDRVNHRVQKFDPDGNLLTIFGGEASKDGQGLFDQPLGLAVASSGNLYVLDVGSKLLQLLDADGKFIAQWSTKGGDLDQAIGIVALDSNDDLYIMARGEVMGANGKATKAIVLKKFQHP